MECLSIKWKLPGNFLPPNLSVYVIDSKFPGHWMKFLASQPSAPLFHSSHLYLAFPESLFIYNNVLAVDLVSVAITMATDLNVCRPYKWFSNRRQQSKSSSNKSSPTSPVSPSTPSGSSTKQEDELKQVFRYFDRDDDGKISALELRAYFGSIGEYMSHEEAQGVISGFDRDGDNLLDFQDFMRLMKREGRGQAEEDDDLKKAFEMFETERGSGRITPKSLQKALHRLGDAKSYDDCVTMIECFDTDGNGVLEFHEFHQMMVA